ERLSSKAAGEPKPEAYPLGYVEDFDEPRTPLADFLNSLLRVVIQHILVRMRAQPHGIDFPGTFVVDPGLDQSLAEDTTLEQELMVLLQTAQRFIQAAWHRADFRRLFRLEIVQILLRRLTGIDLVFDSVQPCHQHGWKCQVGIGGWVGKTHLNPLGLRAWRVHGNPDSSGSIPA